jgi:hypothetical protein
MKGTNMGARKRRLYLSGPMQGIENWNHPAFHAAAKQLRDVGYEVLNPAEYGSGVLVWEDCMRRDLIDLLTCDSVAVLPGWENSRGATLETDVAIRLAMGSFEVEWWYQMRFTLTELLDNAKTADSISRAIAHTANLGLREPGQDLMISDATLREVQVESIRAHIKHGDRSLLGDGLSTVGRLAALVEECGEVGSELTYDRGGDVRSLKKELIQTANVAASWAQWLDQS